MYKVIAVDNLGRDYMPEALITVAVGKDLANEIAAIVNEKALLGQSYFAKVVPEEEELDLSSQYDLIDEDMPFSTWCSLTGARALPEHVAKYWYETTIFSKPITD